MLTVCFDAAGEEDQTNLIVVSGFGALGGKWNEFERLWGQRLKQDGLPYFHAVEFAHSTGAFAGWKGDKDRRAVFVRI
jgi:hypothetical protein